MPSVLDSVLTDIVAEPATTSTDVSPAVTEPVRRSKRVHHPPAYLNEYDCSHVYPIQHSLNYNKLSPHYHDYIMQVIHL